MSRRWLLFFAGSLLLAQGRSSYGPSRIWWDAGQGGFLPRAEDYENPEGLLGMVNSGGSIRVDGHPFFEALGMKRARVYYLPPALKRHERLPCDRRQRWIETDGKDPIFAAVDGSNCPSLPQTDLGSALAPGRQGFVSYRKGMASGGPETGF